MGKIRTAAEVGLPPEELSLLKVILIPEQLRNPYSRIYQLSPKAKETYLKHKPIEVYSYGYLCHLIIMSFSMKTFTIRE